MERRTYYISVGAREISQLKDASPFELEIEANDQEIAALRQLFDEMNSADVQGFVRAHIPFVEYHHDHSNDLMDAGLYKVYKMMHELGKPETKQHIETMGILKND